MTKLSAKKRDSVGKKLQLLRREGMVPAVVYGRGKDSLSLSVLLSDFLKTWKASGESTLIDLEVEGAGSKSVLIHDVAKDPVTERPVHVDFYEIDVNKAICTNVPLVFEGESEAVKTLSGTLLKMLHEVEVEALPKDLPHDIKVDIGSLATFDDHIAIKDLVVPKTVTVHGDGETIVAMVNPPRKPEEDVIEEAPVDLESIEVVKKGKQEDESESEESSSE